MEGRRGFSRTTSRLQRGPLRVTQEPPPPGSGDIVTLVVWGLAERERVSLRLGGAAVGESARLDTGPVGVGMELTLEIHVAEGRWPDRSRNASAGSITRPWQRQFQRRYHALRSHYGLAYSRNTCGVAHENNRVESPHGHLKKRIEQALLLRGSTEFEALAAYQAFLAEVAAGYNRPRLCRLEQEKPALRPLPPFRFASARPRPHCCPSSSRSSRLNHWGGSSRLPLKKRCNRSPSGLRPSCAIAPGRPDAATRRRSNSPAAPYPPWAPPTAPQPRSSPTPRAAGG